jgi:PAS domain S-box-containing protein
MTEFVAPMQLLSLLLLLLGVGLAFSGIRLSGWIVAWILLSGALLLQGFRSILSFLAEHGGVDSATYHTANDWMGLGFSLLIVASMYMMREVFAKHRQTEDKLRIVSAAAQDAIIMMDDAGRIAFWNEAAQRIFGYGAREAQDKKLSELIVPERHRADFDKEFTVFSRTGQGPVIGKTLERAGLRKDGTEIVTEASTSAVSVDDKWHAICVVRDITERKAAEQKRWRDAETLSQSLEKTIQAVAGAVEMRDPYATAHQERVADLACAIGMELGLTNEQLRGLHLAATVHDLGKIRIPVQFLIKPGKLTAVELSFVRTHPQAGFEILQGIEFLSPIANIVLQHHERLDGSGYPQGLKGGEILLEARILGVADVVEAMTSTRAYRPALALDAALSEIIEHRGSWYEAAAVDACIRLFRERDYAFPGQESHDHAEQAGKKNPIPEVNTS